MEKLISLTDFVEKSFDKFKTTEHQVVIEYNLICKYAEFLKQPLTLGMFVPCDEQGNYLDKRPSFNDYSSLIAYKGDVKEYDEAWERVLFKSFSWSESFDKDRFILRQNGANQVWAEMTKISDSFYFRFPNLYTKTVEDLICSVEIELTESAKKQIGV